MHLLSSDSIFSPRGLCGDTQHRGRDGAGGRPPVRGKRGANRSRGRSAARRDVLPVDVRGHGEPDRRQGGRGAVRAEVGERVRALQARTGVQCGLATVMVGDDPASAVYVGNKHRACHEAGMASSTSTCPADIDQDGLHAKIDEVCADPRIHGMIVQLPLPSHLDEDAALDRSLHEGRRRPDAGRAGPAGDAAARPAPGHAERRRRAAAPYESRWPAPTPSSSAARRSSASRRRTCCSSRTAPSPSATRGRATCLITRQADILVAAVGRPEMLTPSTSRRRGRDRRRHQPAREGLVGDVDFASVRRRRG